MASRVGFMLIWYWNGGLVAARERWSFIEQ